MHYLELHTLRNCPCGHADDQHESEPSPGGPAIECRSCGTVAGVANMPPNFHAFARDHHEAAKFYAAELGVQSGDPNDAAHAFALLTEDRKREIERKWNELQATLRS